MNREDKVRKTDEIISRAIALWPLWAMLAGGAVTAVNFYSTVKDLSEGQKKWQESSESRREHLRSEMEDIRTRLTKLETLEGSHGRN